MITSAYHPKYGRAELEYRVNDRLSFTRFLGLTVDVEYGFIRRYEVTDAAVHDSQVLGAVLDDDNQGEEIWADSAYRSKLIEAVLEMLKFLSHIHERAYRNRHLTEEQKEAN